MDLPLTNAEQKAELATKLPSFPVNLLETRRTVAQILSQFGRGNIFSQYTVHDFSHVREMLQLLDWIIPNESKRVMSLGDWLMTTLSIYFHDLALVVTENEFKNRDQSKFFEFCESELFSSKEGADYKSKVFALEPNERDRFLYQEFVRANHAARIRSWISGRPSSDLGYAKASIDEIDSLLSRVSPEFRRDLGLVCESHNLDDIDNTQKYKLSQP
jgi:hypothetical protein